VSRLPASQRLASIATAATEAFRRLGYRGTRTADVAARAGMSAGSLFTYVESKEALFHLVFAHGLGLLPEPPPALPLGTPGPGETLALIERALREIPVPRLRAALAGNEPADVAQELREIVEEFYDLTERYWPLLAVIERCAAEVPELEALWFGEARAGIYAELAAYLQRRVATRRLRPMPDALVAARVVTESVAWFAWHRREGRDSALYDDRTARRTVIEFVCAALVPESAQAGAQPHTARRASPPGLTPDSAPKERPSWTQPPATLRPATAGYPAPTTTGRCRGRARPARPAGSQPANPASDPGRP
jgi:AcrR family transcriptional regulator